MNAQPKGKMKTATASTAMAFYEYTHTVGNDKVF